MIFFYNLGPLSGRPTTSRLTYCIWLVHLCMISSINLSGGPRGGLGGSLESTFETKLLHFHGEFSEKKGKKTTNNQL